MPRRRKDGDVGPYVLKYPNATSKRYGMTEVEYLNMYLVQGGACALCGDDFLTAVKGGVVCVDHDHDTNQARALLCTRCNIRLGNTRMAHTEDEKLYLLLMSGVVVP